MGRWLTAAIISAAFSTPAIAATFIWQGGTGVGNANNWQLKGNWSTTSTTNSPPGETDTAQFDNSPLAGNLAPSIGNKNTSVGEITFISGTTNAYNITGTATLTIGSATVSGITNFSATGQQFTVSSIALGAAQTWSVADAGALAFSSNVVLGTYALTLGGSGSGLGSISGVISGSAGITKTGTGIWALSGANTFSGATTISQGTLQLDANAPSGAAGALGNATSAVVINDTNTAGNNTALLIGTSGVTVGRNITVANFGTGTSTLGSSFATGTGSFTGTITLEKSAVLQASGTSEVTFSGVIGGATNTGITKTGTGTITLSGSNTFTGATTIEQGALRITNSNALGSTSPGTTVTGSGAALEVGGGIVTSAEPLFLSGTGVGGTGALRNASGTNTFSGLVTLQSASLITANSGSLLTLSGGISSANHALTIGTAAQNGNVAISGNLALGTGALIKNGSGNVTFASASTNLTGNVGAVNLNAGSITIGNGSRSTILNTGNFSSVAGTTLTIATGSSVVATFTDTTVFAGAMAGGGNFTKAGGGTLVFNQTFSAPDLTLTLSGGTLSLLGGQFTFGTIHITGNTVLDFNNSAGTFLSSASLVIDAGVVVTVNNWVSIANQALQSSVWYATQTINGTSLTGTDMIGGTPLSQVSFTNYEAMTTGWVAGNHDGWFDHEIRPTPEPATYGAMLLAGCIGLIGWRRWRTKNNV